MVKFLSRNVIRTMDPINSYAKDIKVVRVSSRWEMWVMFAFLGKSCVVVGGGSWGATHTTILKEMAASANHQCKVSRFKSLVLYRGFPIGFKIALRFGACLVLLLTMGPFKEAHMYDVSHLPWDSLKRGLYPNLFSHSQWYEFDSRRGSHGVPSPNMEAKSQL